MLRRFIKEIRPRNGHTLVVLIVCRISGCAKQKELSLDDQEDNAKELIRGMYQGNIEFVVIATTGKGEHLDRPELADVEAAMRSKIYDFAVFDDLSRLIRGEYAKTLLGIGKDHGTRSLCIQDGIDTDDHTWEEDALAACCENVAHQNRTSSRIKQKSMNRFLKFGGPTGRLIATYTAPEGAKTYNEWRKLDEFTPLIKQGREILLGEDGPNFQVVADFFADNGIPLGPYTRLGKWHDTLVRNFYTNPLLKGWPQRGYKRTTKINENGHRPSRVSPEGPEYYHAPHLAHLSEEEFDSLNAYLKAANAHMGRKKVNGVDPIAGRSRAASRFPGLHSVCWYCGFHHVWGANGIKDNLMCRNAREWHCWHSIGFSGPEFTAQVSRLICEQLSLLQGFDAQFAGLVDQARDQLSAQNTDQWDLLRHDQMKFQREKENLQAVIKEMGLRPMLKETIERLEQDEQRLLIRQHQLEHRAARAPRLPTSMSSMAEMLSEEFRKQATDSPKFSDLLRVLVPDVYVYAVRLCDGGHLWPRAKIRLDLGGKFPDLNLVPGVGDVLKRDFTIDLFGPKQRERIREESVRLDATGLGVKAIAAKIKERPAYQAVSNALALQKQMDALGIRSPYVTVFEPPEDYPKVRRHKNERYKFQPREGYVRPEL
jgi:hypothetical protein